MDATYSVPEHNLPKLTDTLKRLDRRALKLGLAGISMSVGDSADVPFWRTSDGHMKKLTRAEEIAEAEKLGKLVFLRYFPVTVTGATPRLAGWEFIGTLQHLEVDGEIANLLRVVPGFKEKLPEHFRTATPENCDHCQKNIRTRKETFVVRSEETGEFKQVGRNCTQDFLGGKDPHAVAKMLELLFRADAAGSDAEGDDGSAGVAVRVGMATFLAWVASCIRLDGWTSRGKAREFDGQVTATADDAMRFADPPMIKDPKAAAEYAQARLEHTPTTEDKELVERALAYAADDLETKKDENDYFYNLWVASNQAAINWKLAGITASLIPHFMKEVERQVIREMELRRTADSKHLGQVGERLTLNVQVAKVMVVGELNQFGPSFLHKLITAEGDAVVWFASGSAEHLKPGQTYTIKASIKKHDERQGMKQTVVSRVVAMTEEMVAAEKAKAERAAKRAAKKASRQA